jgi:hypothetical protein
MLWEAFRANPATDNLYHPDCRVIFMPTGVGAASAPAVLSFYKSGGYSHEKKLSVKEITHQRTVSSTSAVEETEVAATFVSGEGCWLLPGVDPSYLQGKILTFPMVSKRLGFARCSERRCVAREQMFLE